MSFGRGRVVMRKSVLALLLLATGLVVAAPAPLPRRKTDRDNDLAKLQGEWREVAAHVRDDEVWRPLTGGADFVIRGDRLTLSFDDEDAGTRERRIRLHPAMKPKGFDFINEHKGQTQVAAYELQGDTLTIAYAAADEGPRPASLEKARQGESKVTYRRKRR
jgi:uncharacterized protein (TIGR03067 family)